MAKEEKPIFLKALLVVIVLLLIEIGFFFYKYSPNKSFTGFSVREMIFGTYTQVPLASKLFLVAEWIIFASILLFVYLRDRGIGSRSDELEGIDLSKLTEKWGTDIDTLYNLLKTKKQIRIMAVSKLFNVNKDVAISWCKTLESGNLAVIEYPQGGPVIKINEKED